LHKTADEFLGAERHALKLLRAVVAITKGDLAVGKSLQPAVGDRDAKGITGQIAEDFFARSGVLAVDDPGLRPGFFRRWFQPMGLGQSVPHFGAKEDRQGANGNKKVWMFGRRPALILGPSAGTDQQVDMRMIKQRARPGMQHGEDGGVGSQVLGIGGQFLGGGSGAAEQEAVNHLGMLAGQWSQVRGQSERQQIMGTGQQARLLFFQPGGRLLAMTLGTMPVAAGMIGVANLRAVVALCHMAAEKRGAAKFDVAHGPQFLGEQRVMGAIGRGVLAENVRHFYHGQRSWTNCWTGSSSCAQAGAVK